MGIQNRLPNPYCITPIAPFCELICHPWNHEPVIRVDCHTIFDGLNNLLLQIIPLCTTNITVRCNCQRQINSLDDFSFRTQRLNSQKSRNQQSQRKDTNGNMRSETIPTNEPNIIHTTKIHPKIRCHQNTKTYCEQCCGCSHVPRKASTTNDSHHQQTNQRSRSNQYLRSIIIGWQIFYQPHRKPKRSNPVKTKSD